jgi:hypothetical protein
MASEHYEKVRDIGVDTTNGRYGDVTIRRCRLCGRHWLHYQVEYEAFTGSGRYFMGLITREAARSLSPEGAVEYLNAIDWHLYGGAYFGGLKGRSTGKVPVDL